MFRAALLAPGPGLEELKRWEGKGSSSPSTSASHGYGSQSLALPLRKVWAENVLSIRRGGAMYRLQERGEVMYGHYREYVAIYEEMVAVQRARG